MNDIEKQIEGVEEEDIIKNNLNRNRDNDKNKKIIMYVVIGILIFALAVLLVYAFINKDASNDNNDNDSEVVDSSNQESNTEVKNIGYVSCDDNSGLLNVRNSTSGTIIDGLSCYKEVIIEEELEGTDTCDNWYKISYNKSGSSYTGYACGTYIKKQEVSQTIINDIRSLIDKANDYYDNSVLNAYCGKTTDTKTIEFENNMTGEYVKSEYNSIDELKNYLLSFLDEDLITLKLELSDIDNPKYYDNYYEIDNSLYCRNYAGMGWNSTYTNNYDIEVTSNSDNKTTLNIAYQYIDENSDCIVEEISSCNKNDFVYEIGKVTIENNIITKMDFHK